MVTIPRRGEVGQDARRARGTRFASGTDVPQVSPGVTRDPGLNVSPEQFGAAEGRATQGFGENLSVASERLFEAEQRIQRREDVVKIARTDRQARESLSNLARDIETESDLSDPETLKRFGEQAASIQAEALASFDGTADAKATLTARLESFRGEIVDRMATQSVEAQRTLVSQEIGREINSLAVQVAADPTSFTEAADAALDLLEIASPAFTEGELEARKTAAISLLAETVIDTQLSRGNLDAAVDLIEDPSTQRLLSSEALQRNIRRINRARQGIATSEVKGIPRDIFERLTPDQQAQVLGAIPSESTIKGVPEGIFNQLSEEEQRRVLGIESPTERGIAAGQEALAEATTVLGREPTGEERADLVRSKPFISITERGEREVTKQLGKLDAERVIEQENRGQQAFRDLAEIDRMRSALDSGRFTTGVFAESRQFLARVAEFVGAGEETRRLLGDAATADTLDAAASRLAVDAAQKLGRITNMSLQFIRDSLPNLARTPEGNRILLEVMERAAEREIEIATMADRFIQDFGTLRPEGERTFFQAVRDLEESDPVITDNLRQRIIDGSEDAPDTFKDVLSDAMSGEKPKNVEVPDGFEFVRMEGNRPVFRAEREVRSGGRVLPAGTTFLGSPIETEEGGQEEGGAGGGTQAPLGDQSLLDQTGRVEPTNFVAKLEESGLSREVAAGFAGNIQQESGFDPNQVGDNGNAFGLFQHNGPRAKQLFDFAREQGEDVPELTLDGNKIQEDLEQLAAEGKVPSAETQVAFALHELETTEKKAAKAIRNASTPQEAARLISRRFFRPSNPREQNRTKFAREIASNLGTEKG